MCKAYAYSTHISVAEHSEGWQQGVYLAWRWTSSAQPGADHAGQLAAWSSVVPLHSHQVVNIV